MAKIYFSNGPLERSGEKKYKGWYPGDPPHEELLVEYYVPRSNGVGHPGIRVPEDVTHHEMERMEIFLATESQHRQLKKDYNQKQKKEKSLLEFDSI